METFFIAETMKYCYLTFQRSCPVNADDYVFSTEAHPFKKSHFRGAAIAKGLGINRTGSLMEPAEGALKP
jgi:hypothetical protein